MSDDDNTAEFTAAYVWTALTHDGEERRNLGGFWHPAWAGRFDQGVIQRDFDSLDRPGMRGALEGPAERPDVRYAAIIEGAESIDGELVEDRPVARWLTLQHVPELNFWALAHYGPSIVQPFDLP